MSVDSSGAKALTSFAVSAAHRAEVAILDREGVIVAVNDAWTDFVRRDGCADPARCGPGASYLAVCDAAGDEVAASVAAAIRQAVAGVLPVPVRVIVPCDGPDRSRLFVTLVSSRFGDDGQCLGATVVLVAVADTPLDAAAARSVGDMSVPGVTAAGTVEDVIRRQAAILDLMLDAVIVVDAGTLQILHVNDAACRLLCYSRAQLLEMRTPQVRPDLPDQERRALIADLVAQPGVGKCLTDIVLRSRDGRRIDCESRSAAVTDDSGRAIVVHVVRDVGERLALIDHLGVAASSFQTVFEQAPVGALVARIGDEGRRIVRANTVLAHTLGEPAEALIGGDLSRFIDPQDAGLAVAGLTAVAAGRSAEATGVWRFRARDGSRLWLNVRVVPVQLPDLPGPLVLAYLADVTQQQVQERLAVNDASFRTVFDRSPIAALVIRLDPSRPRLVHANQAAAQVFGDSIDGLIAADRTEFTLRTDTDTDTGDTAAALVSGDLVEYTGARRYRRRDGSPFWAEVHAVPIRLPDLTGPLALVHLVDVTERREAEVRRGHTAAANQLIAQVVTAMLAGQALSSSYQQVVEGVAEVFCAENVSIILPDPARDRFTMVGAHGRVATDLMHGGSLPAQEFLTWLTTQADHGLIVPATAPGLPAQTEPVGPMAATSFGAPPTGTSGVLIMARAGGQAPFTVDEVELLTALARQLTLAIRLGQTQSEQRRMAAERDAYLTGLDEALRPWSDPAAIQTVACRMLGEHLSASRVLYADFEDEQVAVVRHDYLHGADTPTGRWSVPGGALADHARRGEPLVIDDITTDPRFGPAERQRLLCAVAPARIVVPLVKSDRCIATVSVHSNSPRRWTDLEVQLTRDTAERTWAAVERSLAEQASAAERTRRQAAERELVEQAAREQRERLEQEFITNAAHELRTPLTGILAAVDALDAGAADDPRQRRRFLAHLRRESTRLARLSDSLLLLAQAQSLGSLPGEPFAVAALLANVAADLHVTETVTVSVDADPDLTLQVNHGLTEILISNLASNAARYTTAGHVRLSARTENAATILEVRDTGPGMDQSTVARARDRFYRYSTTRSSDGFGLGLSIAAQAATAMGATLELHSTPGTGTSVRVTFPPTDSEPPKDAPSQDSSPQNSMPPVLP
jgi:PAS domain S-box-containing protein